MLQNMVRTQFLYCSNPKDPSQDMDVVTLTVLTNAKRASQAQKYLLKDMAVIKEV